MRPSLSSVLAFAAVFALCTAPALAQDKGGTPAPPAEKKPDETKVVDPNKEMARTERARKLVQELEIALETAKTAKPADPLLVKSIEHSLEQAKKLAQPIKLSELTDEEKKALVEEVKKSLEDKKPPGGMPPKDPAGDDMAKAFAAKAFDGVDLSEEEQLGATKVINEWWEQAKGAWGGGDSKKVSDLKNDRNDKLEKLLGKKKAQKVINNLNGMANWGGKR